MKSLIYNKSIINVTLWLLFLLYMALATVASNKIEIFNDDDSKEELAAKCLFHYIKDNELIDATRSILLINSMHGASTFGQSVHGILHEQYDGSVLLISTNDFNKLSTEITTIYQFVDQVVWLISKSEDIQFESYGYFENVSPQSQQLKTHVVLMKSKMFEQNLEEISKMFIDKQLGGIFSKMETISGSQITSNSSNTLSGVTRNCAKDRIAFKVSHTCDLNGHNLKIIEFNVRKNLDSCPIDMSVYLIVPFIFYRSDTTKYAGIEYNLVEMIAETLNLNISYTWLNGSNANVKSANRST